MLALGVAGILKLLMRYTSSVWLSLILTTGVFAYLIGTRFEARFTGRDGQIDACPAVAQNEQQTSIRRGQTLASGSETFATYRLCDGTLIYLDKNTELRLDHYANPDKNQPAQLTLIQGRVIVVGSAYVSTRNILVTTSQFGCEVVHYSWRDEVDVTPLAIEACKLKNPPVTPAALITSRFNTFDSSLISTSPFDPVASSAQYFYEWTGLRP